MIEFLGDLGFGFHHCEYPSCLYIRTHLGSQSGTKIFQAEVIPFFSDLLSLMSSLFDSFFGFIFWGVAYIRMRRVDGGVNWLREQTLYGYMMLVLNVIIIIIGLFFLGAGTYTSVQSIIDSYHLGNVSGVFTCKSNGL